MPLTSQTSQISPKKPREGASNEPGIIQSNTSDIGPEIKQEKDKTPVISRSFVRAKGIIFAHYSGAREET